MVNWTASTGDIWEVSILGKQEQQDCIQVLHFSNTGGDSDVWAHLLQVVANCVLTTLLPGLPNNYRFVGTRGHRIQPTLGPPVEFFPDANQQVVGQVATDSLPSYCACVVSKHTIRGGRSGRGRMFLPPPPESATIASLISPETQYWAAILAFVACIASHFIHDTEPIGDVSRWELGVWSRGTPAYPNRTPPRAAQAPAFAQCTTLVPHRELAVMRSRKVGKGS